MDELPRLEIEGGEWYRAVPPPAVPMPAANMPPDLHGARAILSDTGTGSIYDLRILGDAHRGTGNPEVDVVPELDYWRAKIQPDRPVHPRRVPLSQIYIEHRLPYEPGAEPTAPAEPAFLMRRLAPRPEQPGARTPVPARSVGTLHGRRIIQVTPLGFRWDLRAVSEPFEDDNHDIVVHLTSAQEYYQWVLAGIDPEPVAIGLYLLWTE
ncbi:hypothetical protein [Streptomyces sp. NPDC017940]|uniref:hypothetical protein n=1 Tax=Streptomyces sp. NPDC017940 TaxID=3365017 RepID=UPI0037A5B3FA